jgi:hypothetical protein
MSGRGNKYKSMGASYREGQDDGGGRGRGRGRVNKYRRQLNGNYMKQGQAGGADDSNKPQVGAAAWVRQHLCQHAKLVFDPAPACCYWCSADVQRTAACKLRGCLVSHSR